MTSKRVLIAEDEPSIVVSLEYLLGRAGCEVRTASTGPAAWAALQSWRPDLVLLDLMLPEMDGFEVCRRLRSDPGLAGVRVLMLTAKGRSGDLERGLALGADAYVTKPFGARELMAAVADLLGR